MSKLFKNKKKLKITMLCVIILLLKCCSKSDNIHISIYNKTSYNLQITVFFHDYNYLKDKKTITINAENADSFYLSSNSIIRSKAIVKILNNDIVKNLEYIDINSIVNNIEFKNLNNNIIKYLVFHKEDEFIKYVYRERGISYYLLEITDPLLNLDENARIIQK